MKSYDQQRKDRLQGVIDDYLQDEKMSSRQIFEEILSCIDDVVEYHQKHLDRANDVKMFCVYRSNSPIRTADEIIDDMMNFHKIPKRY